MTRGVAVLRAPLALTLLLVQTGLVRLTELIDLLLVLVETLLILPLVVLLGVLRVALLTVVCLPSDMGVLGVALRGRALVVAVLISLGVALCRLFIPVLVVTCSVTSVPVGCNSAPVFGAIALDACNGTG